MSQSVKVSQASHAQSSNNAVVPTPQKTHVTRGVLLAVAGGVCWGLFGTCSQFLTVDKDIPVLWIASYRLLIAAAIFLIFVVIREPRKLLACLRDIRSLVQIFLFGTVGLLLTQISYIYAISYTNAGTGTVFERSGLIFVMLFLCIRARRLPKLREFIGLILAIGGAFIIATQGSFDGIAIAPEGLIWGIICALALTFYTLSPVKPLERWDSFIVSGLAMFFGGAVCTIFSQPWTMTVKVDGAVIGVMAVMILIGAVLAYVFYLQGLKDAGPMKASLASCSEPVSATLFAAVFLGTNVTLWDMIGCGLIVAMIFLVTERDVQPIEDANLATGQDVQPVEDAYPVSEQEVKLVEEVDEEEVNNL